MRLILFLIFIVPLSTCNKTQLSEDRYVTLTYQQTISSDPWKNEVNDSLTLKNVAQFLGSSGLYVATLSMKLENREDTFHLTPQSKTGKIIYLTTLDDSHQLNEYKKIGFEY